MSSIPNSAMPHAYRADDSRTGRREQLRDMFASARRWAGEQYSSASEAVRRDPRIAAAAGATLVAAIAAVFAPRLWRQRAGFGL
jgi:hypothetical protein